MEPKLVQQNVISLAPEKISLSPETLKNSSNDQHSAIKSKILNAIGKIKETFPKVVTDWGTPEKQEETNWKMQ